MTTDRSRMTTEETRTEADKALAALLSLTERRTGGPLDDSESKETLHFVALGARRAVSECNLGSADDSLGKIRDLRTSGAVDADADIFEATLEACRRLSDWVSAQESDEQTNLAGVLPYA